MSTNDEYVTADGRTVGCVQSGPVFETFTETATGHAATQETGHHRTLSLGVHTTVATGTTPSLTLSVQTSHDGTNWTTVGSLTAITATGTAANVAFGGLDRYVRLSWVISGTTPSFTFATSGELV